MVQNCISLHKKIFAKNIFWMEKPCMAPKLFVKIVFSFKLKSKTNVTETVVKGTVLVLVPQDRAAPD